MKLAFDCDDVLVRYFPRVVECFNYEFGESASMDSGQWSWDDNPVKRSSHFGPGKMFANWWEWWQTRANLWSDCDAELGSIGTLYNLHAEGHYIQLITSKPLWSRKWFHKWLFEWDPYFDDLIIVEEGTGATKASVTDADILVDDKPQNIREWVESGRDAIIYDQPWNQDMGKGFSKLTEGHTVLRAYNWADVARCISTMQVREEVSV